MLELPTGSTLPTGTVTFLFSDIEGSTTLWERDPEKMDASIQIHHAILRHAIESNGGVVFKIVGDEFQSAFPTAPQALKAALQAQRGLQAATWNELGPLRVRMGIHTGEAHLDEHGDEYAVSHTKNRGHRVMEAGHGGQILLSLESAELCQRGLPSGIYLKDLGEHHIRDWKLPEHFYQVIAPGLPKDFPPLRTQAEPKHNLSVQLTSFIGRKKEIRQVESLLKKHRLVTLTGPGGTGKTRLALQVAGKMLGQFRDGVWYVELAPLADPGLVPKAVIRALGLRESIGRSPENFLQDYLRTRQVLLILDNCEHLIEACTRLTDALLHGCRKIHLLATSRESLGVAGEVAFRVPSLELPDHQRKPAPEELAGFEAIQLFVERAETAYPGFQIEAGNASAILRVCQRLDGIPLAIELAAARVKVLEVEQIAGRLDDRFRLLTGGSRTALERHQTLKACIDWSYDLLSAAERALLQRLSVFAGGWKLEAAEYVGCGEDIESCEVLDLLIHLVDKSLVQADEVKGVERRFRFLEMIRQYGQEKLFETGQGERVRDKHLQYYLQLAEREVTDHAQWLRQWEAELDNLRLGLGWALESQEERETAVEAGLRLAASLFDFWHGRGRHLEAIHWLERLIAEEVEVRGGEVPSDEHMFFLANALSTAGFMHTVIGPYAEATRLLEESRIYFQQLGAKGRLGLASALVFLADGFIFQGDEERAKVAVEESYALFTEIGDRGGCGTCLELFGLIETLCGEEERAQAYYEQSLAVDRELGNADRQAWRLLILADVAVDQGDLSKAQQLAGQSLALLTEMDEFSLDRALSFQVYLDWLEGRSDQAEKRFEELLWQGRDQGREYLILMVLSYYGLMAYSLGDYQRAAHLAEECLSHSSKMSLALRADALASSGELAWACGDLEQATRKCEEVLDIKQKFGAGRDCEAIAQYVLGRVAQSRGMITSAKSYYQQALDIQLPIYSLWPKNHLVLTLTALAELAVFEVAYERAARLLGATEKRYQIYHFTIPPTERLGREKAVEAAHRALGEEAFAAAWEASKAMPLKQALAYAKEVTHA